MSSLVRIDIAADPAAAWGALVDVAHWPEWTASIDSLELLDEGPLHVGSRARILQPRMPAMVWRVTELTDERSFTWQSTYAGVATIGSHTIEPTPNGVSLKLEVEQQGVLAAAFKLMSGRRTLRYLQMEAEGLKARAEQA